MATVHTFQYKQTLSLNRHDWMNCVIRNDELSKKDLRVLLHLFTHLDYNTFKEISVKQIAKDLDISKKNVEESIMRLVEMEIIEKGSTSSVKNGYKTTF